MKLSQQSARDLPPGRLIRDHVVKGLELHCGRSGAKSWLYYYRTGDGTRRRPKLGDYPTLSIEAARDVARAWAADVARGADPSRDRQTARHAPTVADLAAVYLAWSSANHKPSTQEAVRAAFKNWIVPKIGTLKVAAVEPADVSSLVESVARGAEHVPSARGERTRIGGRYAANKVKAYLSGAFELCETSAYKWRPRGSNPCGEARHFVQQKRRRHVTADEFPRLAEALNRLESEHPGDVAAIYAVLFSGSRVSEMAEARRSDLRPGGRIELRVHKTDSSGDVRTLRLPRQTQDILASLPACISGKLFGRDVTRHSMHRVFEKARDAAGAPDLQLRDLRRTFASVAKTRGVALDQIGEIFDHRERRTIDNYAFLFSGAADEIVQSTADAMSELMRRPGAAKG